MTLCGRSVGGSGATAPFGWNEGQEDQMPRILVTGLPSAIREADELRDLLIEGIPLAAERTVGLGISKQHVYAHALLDPVDKRPERVVTFTVEGLFDSQGRTAQMRRELCNAISDALADSLVRMEIPFGSIVGWCVRIDRDEDGFVRRGPRPAPPPTGDH